MSLYWLEAEDEDANPEGTALDFVAPPFSPLMQSWTNLWRQVIKMPNGINLKHKLDDTLPKSIAIIARKP